MKILPEIIKVEPNSDFEIFKKRIDYIIWKKDNSFKIMYLKDTNKRIHLILDSDQFKIKRKMKILIRIYNEEPGEGYDLFKETSGYKVWRNKNKFRIYYKNSQAPDYIKIVKKGVKYEVKTIRKMLEIYEGIDCF